MMDDATRPITEAEQATTARARLARAIGLLLPLSPDDVEDIVALGIEGRDAFEELPEDRCEPGASPSYRYAGTRWAVEFRHGRPHLIEAVNVVAQTVRSAVQEEQARFGWTVHLLDEMRGTTAADDRVAELEEDWRPVFAEAQRRDAQEPGRGSQAMEFAERQERRLGRAAEILGAPAVLPHRVPDDALDEGNGWRVARFMIVTILRIDDHAADCRVDYAEDADAVLSAVAQLILGGHRLLRIFDLDADPYQDPVGITVRLSLSDEPGHTYERRI